LLYAELRLDELEPDEEVPLEVDFDVGPDEELELDGVGLADEELEELDVEELEGVGDEELEELDDEELEGVDDEELEGLDDEELEELGVGELEELVDEELEGLEELDDELDEEL
jgi:hypothetical protein